MEDGADQEQEKICSNCKRPISVSAFVLHEAHCRRRLKLCEVCQEPVPLQEMEQHHMENHAPTSCDHCGATMPADRLEEHLESQCPERELNCKYCELEVRAGDYDTHTDACGSRTDFCDRCNVRVMLKEMEEHKLTKCGDLKAAEQLYPEPTLENLPPSYMDGFEGTGYSDVQIGNRGRGAGGILGGVGAEGGQIFFGGRLLPQVGGQGQRREQNLQLDQEWLQEVGGVCEGEDLDRMMAQLIALEENQQVADHLFGGSQQQVSSRDHLPGIDDRLMREGQYPSATGGGAVAGEERDVDDEEMARRLQHTFDHEADMEKADEDLARKLEEEEEEKNNVMSTPSPPTTSFFPAGTTAPINPHHPRSTLTSAFQAGATVPINPHHPRSTLTSAFQAGATVPINPHHPRSTLTSAFQAGATVPINPHHPRSTLTSLLQPPDYQSTIARSRFSDFSTRERERETDDDDDAEEREREREGREERERERQRAEDMLLAEKLEVEERERLQSEFVREMEKKQPHAVETTELETSEREDSDQGGGVEGAMAVDDVELALRLQKKEIEKARAEIARKRREMRDTQFMLEFKQQQIKMGEEEVAQNKAKIRGLRKNIVEISREREAGYWVGGGPVAAAGEWEDEGEEGLDDESTSEPPPHLPPSPPQSPVPVPGSNDPSRLEQHDDGEEPRRKPVARPHPPGGEGGEESIPCQFCHEPFPLAVIMKHQHYCGLNYQSPRSAGRGRGRGRGRVRGRGRGVGRGVVRRRGLEVNLEEVFREGQTHTSQAPIVDESNALCRYCNEAYPQAHINPHQALCDKNPEKDLKHAYKTRLAAQGNHSPSPSPHQPPTLTQAPPQPSPSHTQPQSTSGEEEEGLPCEYCQLICPPHTLLPHQTTCPKRPKKQRSRKPHPVGGVNILATPTSPSEVAPCQFCNKLVPLTRFIKHEAMCRFQRSPSPPSPVLPPSLPPSTTHTHTHTPSQSQQRNNMAAVFYTAPHPSISSSAAPSLALTDDQKTSLGLSRAPHTSSSHPHTSHPHTSHRVGAPTTARTTPPVAGATTKPFTAVKTSATHTDPLKTAKGGESGSGKRTAHTRGLFSGLEGVRLPHDLPKIYMYTSSSQPHSVRAGGPSSDALKVLLAERESSKSDGRFKLEGSKFEGSKFAKSEGSKSEGSKLREAKVGEKVLGSGGQVAPTGVGSATTSGQSMVPTTTVSHTVMTNSSTSGYTAPPASSTQSVSSRRNNTSTLTPSTITTSPTSPAAQTLQNPQVPADPPNHTHHSQQGRRPHEYLPPTGEPSRYIGTDSSTVRPTQSDFEALRRQHSALVPTPIPLPNSLVSNPLKMVTTSTTNSSGLSHLGDLSVIPPISAGPSTTTKKGLVKSTGDKTYYNTHTNTQDSLLGVDKEGVKMMTSSLIQRTQLRGLEVVPNSLQDSLNTAPPPRNTSTTTTDKGNSEERDRGNQKLASSMVTFHGMQLVPMQQQNLGNSLLEDTEKPGHISEPGRLGQKMMGDLSGVEGGGFAPMQQTFNSRNTMRLDNSSSLKEMGLTKSPLKTTKLHLGKKLLKEKDKGMLDVIKITGPPARITNLSAELTGTKSALLTSQTRNEEATTPSPVTNSSHLPHITSPSSTSIANTANLQNISPTPAYSPSEVSPAPPSSSSGVEHPPQFPPTSTPSPTSPADTKFPSSSSPADTKFPSSSPPVSPQSSVENEDTSSGRGSSSREEEDGDDSGADSGANSGSDCSTTPTSTGPLVEYTSCNTYTDHRQSPSVSSDVEGEREEREGRPAASQSEEDEEDDGEMPELEEMPEVERQTDQTGEHSITFSVSNSFTTSSKNLTAQPSPDTSHLSQSAINPSGGARDQGLKKMTNETRNQLGGASHHTPRPSPSSARGVASVRNSPGKSIRPEVEKTKSVSQKRVQPLKSGPQLSRTRQQPQSVATHPTSAVKHSSSAHSRATGRAREAAGAQEGGSVRGGPVNGVSVQASRQRNTH